MQLQLPLFSFRYQIVQRQFWCFYVGRYLFYLRNGEPTAMHDKDGLSSFRCKMAQFFSVGLCSRTQECKAFHVKYAYVKRFCKLHTDKGEADFWEKDNRQGHAYKATQGMLIRIQ